MRPHRWQPTRLPVPGILQARTLLHTSPLWWKEHLFWFLVVEVLVGLHRTNQISFFSIPGCGIFLYYSDIEWFALEMNSDHSVIFKIAPNYHISEPFLDYEELAIDYEQLEHLTSVSFLDFFFWGGGTWRIYIIPVIVTLLSVKMFTSSIWISIAKV